jgi:cyanate lyase
MFAAKKSRKLTYHSPLTQANSDFRFEQIGDYIGRDEVAIAAIFYGQAKASVPPPPKAPVQRR